MHDRYRKPPETASRFIPWWELRPKLARAGFQTLRAAYEILGRRLVPVRGRRPDKLTSERIEHLLTERSFESLVTSVISTEDGFFVDVQIDWPKLVEELEAAGYAFVADGDLLSPEDEPPPSLRGRNLERWAEEKWAPDYKTLPDRDRLLALARKEVSPNVTRQQIRDLRRQLAPAELRRGGAPAHRG